MKVFAVIGMDDALVCIFSDIEGAKDYIERCTFEYFLSVKEVVLDEEVI